ncbi:MAG: TonB-dependent receptor [Paraprevotella sp.]|nr:TonB-dependent receptor [Paraprevotella sp.]
MIKKRNVLTLVLCLLSACLWAQKVTVSGVVAEEDTNEPVFAASVVLLNADSTLVTGCSSKMDGKFSIPAVKPGKYLFRITYVGFKPYYKNLQLTASHPSLAMGTVKLEANAVMLKAAEVTARQAQVEMKADTFVYNAGAYRVPEGSALEELVKKLPGAEVSDDGTIKINGKEVKKIMIDGKEFFDTDTKIAMKNLPTNMVEIIKAYDRQSDYTRMTGIDDGEEETVLDLSVKKDMKKGWISDIDLGYGTKDRYTGRMMVNRFTDKLRLTVLGSANNMNDRGFPGSGGFGGFGGGGGLVASKMAGMDFNWENGKQVREAGRLRIGGNVRYSNRSTDALSTTNSETFLNTGANSSFDNSKNLNRSGNTDVSSNFRFEWSPDTMTRVMFFPNFSYSKNYRNGESSSVTFNDDPYARMTDPLTQYEDYVKDSIVVNDNKRWSHSDGNSYSFDGTLMANRRLNNKGRNLSLRLQGGYSDSQSNSHNISDVNYFLRRDDAGNPGNDYTRRYSTNPSKSYNASANLSYSEPLFAGAYLQFSYRYQYRYTDSDRSMYEFSDLIDSLWQNQGIDYRDNIAYLPGIDVLGAYIDTQNSQYATYKEHNQDATVMFRYSKEKIRLNAGVSLQPQKTFMDYQKGSLDTTVVRNVMNWAPRVDFRYKFSDTGQLRFRYNGRSAQPSMTNLLDVTDDSDPLNVSKGNPGLKPSWTNSMSLFYNNYVTDKQRGWMVNANMSMTNNSISTAVLYDESSGQRTTMPININGNWNSNVDVMFNTAMGAKKYFNFFTFTNYGYTNAVGYISSDSQIGGGDITSDQIVNLSQKSTTRTTNLGERMNLNFRNDLLEVGVNGNINYQHARNALQTNANMDTYTFSYGGNVIVNFPWNMSLATNIGENCRRGYDDASMNTNELIWNAQLSQSFLKQNAATVSVQWYDILHEMSNISRSLTATQRTDTWTNAINSYVMVHFIYRLNLMGSREARASMGRPGDDGFGPGPDRGPGGFGGPGGHGPG